MLRSTELARSCEVGLATISKALAVIFPVPGQSSPDRMPTRLLAKLKRTPEAQVLWKRLPEGLRRQLLVWIDCLYFPSEAGTNERSIFVA
jgi:hypothetical protein